MHWLLLIVFIAACHKTEKQQTDTINRAELLVLGTVQDGGAPHAGCEKTCCANLWKEPRSDLKVVSLALCDLSDSINFMVEATPDFPEQLHQLKNVHDFPLGGILLTHAHIGHYAGLIHLGREVMGARRVSVYAMPLMQNYLRNNGPWSQLIDLENIVLKELNNQKNCKLSSTLSVTPIKVPHRDEYSETVGFHIKGPNRTVLFIPDIDKWSKWEHSLLGMVKAHDLVFMDATFFDADELPGRNMADIPHPLVVESMAILDSLPKSEKEKVYFIHTNHTNPLIREQSAESRLVLSRGYQIARRGMRFDL